MVTKLFKFHWSVVQKKYFNDPASHLFVTNMHRYMARKIYRPNAK